MSSDQQKLYCGSCPAGLLGLCQFFNAAASDGGSGERSLQPEAYTTAARQIICRQRDVIENVPFICRGIAASSITLEDGRKQILSFILSGEVISVALLFDQTPHCLVEAITEVQCRNFKRAELKEALRKNPDWIQLVSRALEMEKWRSDQLALDLGCRTARERIARLILNLMERFTVRGLAQDQTMKFPLRQHHIAEATGLTPVHVNKMLLDFRRLGVIEIGDRSITVLKPDELRRMAILV